MRKIWAALNHLGMALFFFVALTAAFLWTTGSLHIGLPKSQAVARGGHDHEADAETPQPSHDGEPHDKHAERNHGADWCAEHGVPESACTQCNPDLIAAFKAKGDWCAEHGLPESQCAACNAASTGCPSGGGRSEEELEALAKRPCEHGKPTVECDECRYEIGLVKVEPSVAKALLETETVARGKPTRALRLTGEVQLDRTRVVDVPPTASGRVVEVKAFLGDRVTRGDVLAVVHSSEFGEAKAAYLGALTEYEIAHKEQERQSSVTAALDNLLEHLAKATAGEAEREPSVNDVPEALVGEWKAKLLGAAARLKLAESVHEREKDLWKKGVSSKAEHDEAHQDWEAAQAAYAALVEEVSLNLSLEKLRADNAVRKAQATLHAAEQRLHIFGLAEADVTRLRQQRDNGDFARLPLKAPRTGTIIAQSVSEGTFVEMSASLYTIADLSNLWVWCDVYERDLAALHAQMDERKMVPATVQVAAFPKLRFPGRIDLLDTTLDEHTRTVKARVQVTNDHGRLRPGMFVTVDVTVHADKDVTLVPREAVLTDEGKSFVFQHWRDDLWVRRAVTVGEADGAHAPVFAGLSEGATVVSSGGFMLKGDILRNKMGAG